MQDSKFQIMFTLQLLTKFINGDDRSLLNAQLIEVELDKWFEFDLEIDGYETLFAMYRPEGGWGLYNEFEMISVANNCIRYLISKYNTELTTIYCDWLSCTEYHILEILKLSGKKQIHIPVQCFVVVLIKLLDQIMREENSPMDKIVIVQDLLSQFPIADEQLNNLANDFSLCDLKSPGKIFLDRLSNHCIVYLIKNYYDSSMYPKSGA